MNVQTWIQQATASLAPISDSPRLEAQRLLAHALGVERTWLIAHPEEEASPKANELLARRQAREPLAYILGTQEFFGRVFHVGPGVLIPRQDTETLVESSLALVGESDSNVLDIGTGSGILAVTLKLERPHWALTAVDISPEALVIARQNAQELRAEIEWLESDLFQALSGRIFDLIVSNPPYIDVHETLPREVREFEPQSALFAGEGGLAIYRRLAQESPAHLAEGGLIAMEVGHTQAEAVKSLFEATGWCHIETRKDLADIPRVVAFRRPREG